MAFDYSKLRGRIREKYGTQEKFAKAMGLAKATVSKKLNNIVYWTQDEINCACNLLGIGDTEVTLYFFTQEVQKTKQKAE